MLTTSLHSVHMKLIVVFLLVPMAKATYSIVGTDIETRKVGGAGATCLPDRDIYEALYHGVANRSVLHAQGLLLDRSDPIITAAKKMMQDGEYVDDVLNAMKALDTKNFTVTDELSFFEVDVRQWGIADFKSHAAHSGEKLATLWNFYGYSDSIEQVDAGSVSISERYNYHAMGNIVSNGTVKTMQFGFESEDNEHGFGLDLAGRLMEAIYLVAKKNLGDLRCQTSGDTTASGAYLHVDNPDGTEFIYLNVVGDGKREPVEDLRDLFEEWRGTTARSSSAFQLAKVSIFALAATSGATAYFSFF